MSKYTIKNKFLLITIFCLISNLIFSFNHIKVNLNENDKNRLRERAKKDILRRKRRYWPKDAKIRLEGCYLLDDERKNTENPRYEVCIIGSYQKSPREMITKATTITYLRNRLIALGINVPK